MCDHISIGNNLRYMELHYKKVNLSVDLPKCFFYIPIISEHCELLSANDKDSSRTVVLPIDSVIEKTVSIAERLSETDVSAPVKITEIGQEIKNQIIEHIDNTRLSASWTAEIRHMVASFNSLLAKLEIYIGDLHRILIKDIGKDVGLYFRDLLKTIEDEIERVIHIHN